jgi:hypothetical protein
MSLKMLWLIDQSSILDCRIDVNILVPELLENTITVDNVDGLKPGSLERRERSDYFGSGSNLRGHKLALWDSPRREWLLY